MKFCYKFHAVSTETSAKNFASNFRPITAHTHVRTVYTHVRTVRTHDTHVKSVRMHACIRTRYYPYEPLFRTLG